MILTDRGRVICPAAATSREIIDHDVTTSQGKEKGGLPVVAGMGHLHGEGHGGLN